MKCFHRYLPVSSISVVHEPNPRRSFIDTTNERRHLDAGANLQICEQAGDMSKSKTAVIAGVDEVDLGHI